MCIKVPPFVSSTVFPVTWASIDIVANSAFDIVSVHPVKVSFSTAAKRKSEISKATATISKCPAKVSPAYPFGVRSLK